MQITQPTIDVLKNFANISQSIVIPVGDATGTVLRVVSPQSNLMAIIKVADQFTEELPIYDMSQFLAVVSAFENPVLEADIGKNSLTIKSADPSKKSKSKMFFADKSMIKQPPANGINMPAAVVTFTLTNETLQKLLKMASVLSLPDLVINASNGVVKLEATDSKNDSSNSFEVIVDENYSGQDYKFYIKTDLLKFIPGNYTVNIAAQKISEFVSEDGTRKYYVALEPKA